MIYSFFLLVILNLACNAGVTVNDISQINPILMDRVLTPSTIEDIQKSVIRKAKLDDMKSVMRAHTLSIEEICSKDYTSEQIAKWADVNYSNDVWQKSVLEEIHYVIEVFELSIDFLRKNRCPKVFIFATKKSYQGTGLGLSIAKKIIESHKG